jgi:hypothetical protein
LAHFQNDYRGLFRLFRVLFATFSSEIRSFSGVALPHFRGISCRECFGQVGFRIAPASPSAEPFCEPVSAQTCESR